MMSNRIKEMRKSQKKTLREVADSLDTSNQNVSNWERGNSEPKLEIWIKLADYFNVSVPYLQGVSDNEELAAYNVGAENTFDLLDDGLHITIGGKNMSTEDIEKIREYALFITKSD
ncbi:helix-turn-helix domain-containing protein [Leuconostoc lactis]|uniref:helix-turn-helix domain-containing protein n=1 Tax=Leuconostoc lactis TaxID=1246 RepID=UPI0024ACE1E9|nr:helix-turn-helix transcriptional regulator [Leuconostoc lactis]MDI6495495.1 helix-turn-helix transcriptional regulator [Leuconostoc lactis]